MASLGNDLATIRKEQNISFEDIHEATKIPKHIISAIEDDSIFDDLDQNATYIRSYVRSYAKVLSIKEKDIIYALNKKEKGAYSGSLRELSDTKNKRTFEFDEGQDKPADEEKSKETQDEDQEQMVHDHSPEFSDSDASKNDDDSLATPPATQQTKTTSDTPNVRSVDWADMGKQFSPLKRANPKFWIGLAAIAIVVGAGAFFFFWNSEPSATENTETPVTTSDTRQSSPTSATDSADLNIIPPVTDDTLDTVSNQTASTQNNTTLESLPDTLDMVLYAAYGKLEPVRVYTDIMDNINPYWVEQGEALRFPFVNELRVRGQFSRIVLLLNGHVVQNIREEFYNPDTRLLEINRTYFEGDPKWLQPAPDSLTIDAPAPTIINERPTFN